MPKTHGQSNTLVYQAWAQMHQRCSNPKDMKYKHYGARGISVCDAWSSFESFITDMGDRPEGMTLDRIDNDGNYCPENCRWASHMTQNHNSRRRIVPLDMRALMSSDKDSGMTYYAIAKKYGFDRSGIRRTIIAFKKANS